jgi:hypothetical protein
MIMGAQHHKGVWKWQTLARYKNLTRKLVSEVGAMQVAEVVEVQVSVIRRWALDGVAPPEYAVELMEQYLVDLKSIEKDRERSAERGDAEEFFVFYKWDEEEGWQVS